MASDSGDGLPLQPSGGPQLPQEPADSLETPTAEKPSKDRRGKLNRFLQNAKPAAKIFKGFRRGEGGGGGGGAEATAPLEPQAQEVESEETRIKKERHAAQVKDYEERLAEWEADKKRKMGFCELHGLSFDEEDFPPQPTPPAPLSAPPPVPHEGEPSEAVQGPLSSHSKSSFRPIESPVVAEEQGASHLAEIFAAKAFGGAIHSAAAPGATTSVSAANFGATSEPMLPPRADAKAPAAPPTYAAPRAYHPPPPPAVAPHAAGAVPPSAPAAPPMSQYAASATPPADPQLGGAYGARSRGVPMAQSSTYVDPMVVDQIRRGRELTQLAIREEEGGNMGSAKQAYIKSLELILPAVQMLDHGSDANYQFRMREKQKLKREAALMLDRCEAIKSFLEQEVAALNTRNLLDQASVPTLQPKSLALLRQESMGYDDLGTSSDNSPGPGDIGVARKPPAAKTRERPDVMPPPPPPPPASLLEGFNSLSLSDPLAQQSRPMNMPPAPLPDPLSRDQLAGGKDRGNSNNQQR